MDKREGGGEGEGRGRGGRGRLTGIRSARFWVS